MAFVLNYAKTSFQSLTSSYNSLETLSISSVPCIPTVIRIDPVEGNERTPLLGCQWQQSRTDYQSVSRYDIKSPTTSLPITDIHESNERYSYADPPYRKQAKANICDLRLFVVFFISIGGFVIASYLLIVESRTPTLGFTLELVNHDIWSKLAIPMEAILKHSNISNIIVLHTGGPSCDNSLSCTYLLNQMQQHHWFNRTELPYNFLVGDDGQTYEVRGWDHDSGYSTTLKNDSIVIGFIGNFTDRIPNNGPVQSALSLIRESIRRKKLLHNYRIYAVRNVTTARNDAEALVRHVANWPHFEKLLVVV